MSDNSYVVYLHRNKEDGRVYIGLTGKDPKKRWRNGNGYRGERDFFADIQTHGWESFSHEIIASDLNREEAASLERELIQSFDSTNPNKGYNRKPGGTCGYVGKHHSEKTKELLSKKCSGWKHSDAAKRKISEAGKGKIFTAERRAHISVSLQGRSFSDEHKKRLSEAHKGFSGWGKGRTYSIEHRQHLSESHRNSSRSREASRRNLIIARANGPWNRKKVLCVETGETWPSATAAASAVGCAQTSISEACRMPHRTCKGYHWRYLDTEAI